jgi:hypothetical protein
MKEKIEDISVERTNFKSPPASCLKNKNPFFNLAEKLKIKDNLIDQLLINPEKGQFILRKDLKIKNIKITKNVQCDLSKEFFLNINN